MVSLHKSLTFKAGLIIVAVEAVILAIFSVISYQLIAKSFDRGLTQSAYLVEQLLNHNQLRLNTFNDKNLMRKLIGEELRGAYVVSIDGKVLHATDPSLIGKAFDKIEGAKSEWLDYDGAPVVSSQMFRGQESFVFIDPLYAVGSNQQLHYGYVIISLNASQVSSNKRALAMGFIVGSLLCVVITSGLILLLFQRLILQRISHFLTAFEKVRAGDLEVRVQPDASGDELSVLEKQVNVTLAALAQRDQEQAADRAQIKEKERDLRITLQSIGDAVIATDTKGVVTRMNQVAEDLTGWPREEGIGTSLDEVMQLISARDQQPVANPFTDVLRTGEAVKLSESCMLCARDGTKRPISDSASPILDEQGEMLGVVLVFRDKTDEMGLQEQLRHAQKMDAIGQLAGGVAHDFNNMLGGIIGFADLLALRLKGQDEKLLSYVESISDAALSATGLTQQLLSFARKGEAVSTPFDVHECIQNATALLQRSLDRKIEIDLQLEATRAVIVGDPNLIQNAILNLGVNARDAMPDGGQLRITTSVIFLDPLHCKATPFELQPGNFLHIEVQDTGEGMPPETVTKIFEPFFTTKDVGDGTGLGLSIVYGAVKNHQGEIFVYSEQGTGTVFHINLPLKDSTPLKAFNIEENLISGMGTVLVVDDEPVVRSMATNILTELGYTVLTAEDGEVGIQMYKTHQEEIDLVIVDMVMPKSNGAECFHAIRAMNPEARVLLSSGFVNESMIDELQQEGAMGFIRKPYRITELSKQVAAAIKK